MRRVRIGLVAAGCLLPWSLGCCSVDRHGVIIRGVCSLEFNRVPWRTCAEPVCPQPAPGCGVAAPPGGHGEAVPAPAPVGPQPPSAAPGSAAACPAPAGGSCVGQREVAGAAIAEADHVHSRFHPVPTRPVFWPRPAASPPIPGGPFPQSPGGMPPPNQVSSFQRNKPPPPIKLEVPDPPEEEPPQAPLPPGDREVHVPRRLGTASGASNWMFPSLGFLRGWGASQGQARRDANGDRAVR